MESIPSEVHDLPPGVLARRSGVAISTLHFYENRGLICSYRTEGNQRRYARDTLRRIAFIKASQRVGISLEQIAEALASLPNGRTPNKADWERLSNRWRRDLDERIAQLTRLRDGLTNCIGCGCLSLSKCKLSNPDDVFGATADTPSRL